MQFNPLLNFNLRKHSGLKMYLVIFTILLTSVASIYMLFPSQAKPADVPEDRFSAKRALAYLEVIGQKAHPVGSIEHGKVQDFIIEELKGLGLQPMIQQTTRRRSTVVGYIQNLVVTVPGTESKGKALLVVGHYDTVPTGPGVSDNGAAVAAMLETIRMLQKNPVQNDIIFLFSDAEENGLIGADTFIRYPPQLIENIGFVINLEARGTGGPSLMFETSQQNGPIIREFAKSGIRTTSNSAMFEIYDRMPNGTDFSRFKALGLPGLNFAYIFHQENYHRVTDDLEHLSQASLQHHGDNLWAAITHYGNMDLQGLKGQNAVYFDLFGQRIIHYPESWVIYLTGFSILLFLVVLGKALSQKTITFLGMIGGFFVQGLTFAVSGGVIFLVWQGLKRIPLLKWRAGILGMVYHNDFIFLGFAFLALILVYGIYRSFREWMKIGNLIFGGLLWWGVLTVVTSIIVPGASYLFFWPFLISSLIWLPIELDRVQIGSGFSYLLLIPPMIAIILLVPLLYAVSVGFGLDLAWGSILLFTLILGLILPLVNFQSHGQRFWVGCCLLLVIFSLGFGIWSARFTSDKPKLNSLFYIYYGDSGEGMWASTDYKTDSWTSQYLGENPEQGLITDYLPNNSDFPILVGSREERELTTPKMELIEMKFGGGQKYVKLRVIPTDPNSDLIFHIKNQDDKIERATIEGVDLSLREEMRARCIGLQVTDGTIELAITLKEDLPVKINVVEEIHHLPEFAQDPSIYSERAPYMEVGGFGDITLLARDYVF